MKRHTQQLVLPSINLSSVGNLCRQGFGHLGNYLMRASYPPEEALEVIQGALVILLTIVATRIFHYDAVIAQVSRETGGRIDTGRSTRKSSFLTSRC